MYLNHFSRVYRCALFAAASVALFACDSVYFSRYTRDDIDKIYRERALETYLREQPFLRHLSEADLQQVMAQTEFGTYGDYDWSGEYKRLAQSGEDHRVGALVRDCHWAVVGFDFHLELGPNIDLHDLGAGL